MNLSAPVRVARHNYMGTLGWTDWLGWVSNFAVRPVLLIATLGVFHDHLHGDVSAQLVLGLVFYGIVVTLAMGLNSSLLNDAQYGTLTMALATPVPPTVLWAGRLVAHVPNAVATAVIGFVFARVAFGANLFDEGAVSVAAAGAVVLSGAATALVISTLTLRGGQWAGPVSLATGLILTLSGVVIPRDALPPVLQTVSAAVPVSHANDVLQRTSQASGWADVAAEVAVAVAIGLVAAVLFAAWLRRARRDGRLSLEPG